MNYRHAALSGAFFSALGYATKGLFQILSIVVLARLLLPEDFGVVGMVFPIIAFAAIFQEAGLGIAVLQRSTITDEELSTLFWVNTAVGLLLAGVLVVLSPFTATLYHEPRVEALTAASGAMVLLAALSAQHIALLNRSLRFRELAIIDAVSIATGTSVAVATAYMFETYWAIWLLSFTSTAVMCVLSWAFSGWRPGRRAPLVQVVDLLRFGGNITLSSLFTYFGNHLDKVMIGRVWGSVALGIYERAFKVVLLPILFVHTPLFRLVVPMLSRTRDDAPRYRRIFITSFQLSLVLTVPGIAVLAAAAEPMVVVILGADWLQSAPVFSWLAVACLAQLVTGPLAPLYVSQNRSRDSMMAGIAVSIYSCGAFAIGLSGGAVGVAKAYAISEIIRIPATLWFATRIGPVRFGDAARAVVPFVVATPLCFATVRWLTGAIEPLDQPFQFALIAAALSYAVALPCLLVNRAGRACVVETLHLTDTAHQLLRTRLLRESRSTAG